VPIRHEVKQGDSVISLSERHGHFAVTIWDDPANAELKAERDNMNALLPGDVVVIPDKRPKGVSKPATQRHKFRRKGVPAQLRLQIFDVETPRASQDYTLVVDGAVIKGTTDARGVLEEWIDPGARRGKITIGPDKYLIELTFGHLDPHDELPGIQKRLNNLGFDCGEPTGQMNDKTQGALRAFQARFGLPITGEPDQATIDKLTEQHDDPSEFPAQEPST